MRDRLQAYENVDHVLKILSDIHARITDAFKVLSEKTSDSRRKLVLNYLAEDHSRRAAALSDYRKDSDPTLLRQWFQVPLATFFTGLIDMEDSLRRKRTRALSSFDQI